MTRREMAWQQIQDLLAGREYLPAQLCYWNDPALIETHVEADVAIAAAYIWMSALGAVLLVMMFIKLRRHPLFGVAAVVGPLFAAFVVLCGLGHAYHAWVIFSGDYWIEARIKQVTALVSVATAVVWTIFVLNAWRHMRRHAGTISPQGA